MMPSSPSATWWSRSTTTRSVGIFGFNGTTEWALDSIEQQEVVWLPREDQLRTMLGDAFVALQATPGGFVVVIVRDGREERHIDIDAECAYARAVLLFTGLSAWT